jgi:hypothetical protein
LKKITFGLITTEKYILQKFDCGVNKINAVGDAGRINCSSFSNRTKEEAEGTAAHRRRARFGGYDTQDAIPGPVGGK